MLRWTGGNAKPGRSRPDIDDYRGPGAAVGPGHGIQRGAYREPLSLAARFAGAARQRNIETAAAAAVAPDRSTSTLRIVSSEDLVVDNNYGRMDLDSMCAGGMPERLSVVGRATIQEGGVLYLGGRTYQVESGVIDFTNPR